MNREDTAKKMMLVKELRAAHELKTRKFRGALLSRKRKRGVGAATRLKEKNNKINPFEKEAPRKFSDFNSDEKSSGPSRESMETEIDALAETLRGLRKRLRGGEDTKFEVYSVLMDLREKRRDLWDLEYKFLMGEESRREEYSRRYGGTFNEDLDYIVHFKDQPKLLPGLFGMNSWASQRDLFEECMTALGFRKESSKDKVRRIVWAWVRRGNDPRPEEDWDGVEL